MTSGDPEQPRRLEFQGFVLDTRTLELWRDGEPVSIEPKPAQVLRALVLQAGELVTREELYEVGWGDTVVTLDVALNTAIRSVRRALGDQADAPLFVQTVSGRGYRFLASVSMSDRGDRASSPILPAPPRRWIPAGLAAVAAAWGALALAPDPTVAVEPVALGMNGDPATGQVLEARMRAEMARRSGRGYALLARQDVGGADPLADYLVRSSLQGRGTDSSWFTVEIVRAQDGSVVWGGEFNPDCPFVEDPTGYIARYVATKVRP